MLIERLLFALPELGRDVLERERALLKVEQGEDPSLELRQHARGRGPAVPMPSTKIAGWSVHAC